MNVKNTWIFRQGLFPLSFIGKFLYPVGGDGMVNHYFSPLHFFRVHDMIILCKIQVRDFSFIVYWKSKKHVFVLLYISEGLLKPFAK